MSKPIADYALIGDGLTAALVASDGSIDWLCWPRFNSDALFAALLGAERNGHWRISPAGSVVRSARTYRKDTMILDTTFETEDGTVRLTDFMPAGASGHSALVRIVTGLEGVVEMEWVLDLRFDYGSMPPWVTQSADGIVGIVGPDLTVLRTDALFEATDEGARGRMRVSASEVRTFTLQYGASCDEAPSPVDVATALASTEGYWRDWIGRHDRPSDWPAAVRRSLLTLKALIHAPTGGLVAAPTLGLPEQPGGTMNWDYRYCWLRDSTFTLAALMNAGFHEEPRAWIAWLLRAVGGLPDKMRIVYRLDGARRLEEWEVPWLPGHEGSHPVRVGNAAAGQRQLDVYGEVLDTLQMADHSGLHSSAHAIELARKLAEHVAMIWREPDQGMWESRDAPQHYVYSKCMAWVAIDRALKLPGALEGDARARFETLCAAMHREICELGFDVQRDSFVQHYGSDRLDASLLLLPLVGFLPANDLRMVGTIAAIERELIEGGLVRRQKASQHDAEEGAFIACSCWLADCMALQGRWAQARELFERVLALQNDVGLLAEEFYVPSGRMIGNFPQALSHLALVNTALGLCGPVMQRGGG